MSEFIQEITSQIQRYCEEKINPTAESDDHEELFRKDVYQGFGELGLTGLTLAEEYGGANLDYQTFCPVLATIAKYSVSYSVTLSVSVMAQSIIQEFGNDDQKKTYLPELTSGKEIAGFALSESFSGSDAAALKTTAKKTAEGYILNGSKMWITSGGIAKTYIVMARTGEEGPKGISAFIVQDGMDGFSYGKKEKKMGWKVSPTRELLFENCFVPKENLLSEEGQGFHIALSALNRGRVTIGAVALGLSDIALETAIKYALGRNQFGKAIYDFQGLQFLISECATEIESSRYLVAQAAKNFDDGKIDRKLAAMAKLKATDTAMKVTTDAVQILGGVGYTSEYPTERYMRDAKVLQIVEGTNQIQKVIIGRELKKEFS